MTPTAHRRWTATLLLAAAFTPPTAQAADSAPLWVCVTAPALRESIEPLAQARRRAGYDVRVIETTRVASEAQLRAGDSRSIRAALLALFAAPPGGPAPSSAPATPPAATLLLVGAISPGPDADWRCVVPAVPGTIGRMSAEPSDNGYGSCDEDLLPNVAVGRFPARSPDESAAMVKKTLAAEQPRPGEWKRRLLLLAGSPSYNPTLDQTIERLVMAGFDRVEPAWSGQVIYDNDASIYTLPDADLAPRAREFLAHGPAVVVYLGHSGAEGFWYRPARPPLLSRRDWALAPSGSSVLFATFGCNGAQLGGPDGEGYGVHAMRNPNGPAAVIGSHGVCWAAMSLLMAQGLLDHLPKLDADPRLADLWLNMKRRLAQSPLNPVLFAALDAVDGDPNTPQEIQRREHQEMFVLLGDPALRLPRFEFALRPVLRRAPGGRLLVTAQVPPPLAGAVGRVALERTLTSRPTGLTAGVGGDRAAMDTALRGNHAKANDFVLSSSDVRLDGRELRVELPLSPNWPDEQVLVRVYLRRGDAEAAGVTRLDE